MISFHVLFSGRYRKHLVRCKECNDLWAINMHASLIKVQDCVKKVIHKMNVLEHSKLSAIFHVCQDVMSCSIPPTRLRDGVSTCHITGMKVDNCIIISKLKNNVSHRASKSNRNDTTSHHSVRFFDVTQKLLVM